MVIRVVSSVTQYDLSNNLHLLTLFSDSDGSSSSSSSSDASSSASSASSNASAASKHSNKGSAKRVTNQASNANNEIASLNLSKSSTNQSSSSGSGSSHSSSEASSNGGKHFTQIILWHLHHHVRLLCYCSYIRLLQMNLMLSFIKIILQKRMKRQGR